MDWPNAQRKSFSRSLAREIAFQYLYQEAFDPAAVPAVAGDETGRTALGAFGRKVLETLDEDDVEEASPRGAVAASREHWHPSSEAAEFAEALILGVRRQATELDERLAAAAENWSLGRMAPTDRTILRLGAYEVLYTDTPDAVAVDEAVELAKRFGGAHSSQFVNGVLDRVMREKATNV